MRAYRNLPPDIGWSAEDRRKLEEARSKEVSDLNERLEALGAVMGSAWGRGWSMRTPRSPCCKSPRREMARHCSPQGAAGSARWVARG